MSLIVNTLANLITIDIAVYLTRKKKCCSPVFLHVHTIPMEKRNFIMFKKKKKNFYRAFFTVVLNGWLSIGPLVVLFGVIDEF
jgi:hypothetical protein